MDSNTGVVTMENEGSSGTSIIPCLCYGDFDRFAQYPLPAIYQNLQGVQSTFYLDHKWFNGFFQSGRTKYRLRRFTVFLEINLSKAFYASTNGRIWHNQMRFYSRLHSIGKTSMLTEATATDNTTGLELIKTYQKEVLIQYSAERTKPEVVNFPPSFLETYSKYTSGEDFDKLVFPELPEKGKSFVHGISVMYSDTDHNRHTNMCSYIQYSLNCGVWASQAGFYAYLPGNPAVLPIKKHQILYSGESYVGDDIQIHTWDETDHQGQIVVYFFFVKKDRIIVKSKAWFHLDVAKL